MIDPRAIHEAGHAVVAILLDQPVQRVWLSDDPDPAIRGAVELAPPVADTKHGPDDLLVLLAGPAAELAFGVPAVERASREAGDVKDAMRHLIFPSVFEELLPIGMMIFAMPAIYHATEALAIELERSRRLSGEEAIGLVHRSLGADLPAAEQRARQVAELIRGAIA